MHASTHTHTPSVRKRSEEHPLLARVSINEGTVPLCVMDRVMTHTDAYTHKYNIRGGLGAGSLVVIDAGGLGGASAELADTSKTKN